MLLGYGLVLYRRGTRLARLYSLAVQPQARGQGVAVGLMAELEAAALARHCLYLRLEVAKNNSAAIALYRGNGYQIFGAYSDYYQDHSDALRMQKRIRRFAQVPQPHAWPWYPQTTEFTCGPAALMMAMAGLRPELELSQSLELDLWREATTIFMTSGHGGCHPFGLALAAAKRGFNAQVWVNTEQPLFIEGVRSEYKKNIMTSVHQQFFSQCQQAQVPVNFQDFDQQRLAKALVQGSAVLVLISTFRLAGKKAPHWVLVTGMDDECFYLQDPDYEPEKDHPLDCQYLPIAKQDFEKMASYGSGRLRAAVIVSLVGTD